MTPEERFAAALQQHDARALEQAIADGADPLTKGDDGELLRGKNDYSALHVAARGTPALARTLLDAGFPVDVLDDQKRTPLASVWETEVFEMLLDAGADPHHLDMWKCSALFYLSSARDSHHCVRRLLELGVDATPLHEHGERSWFSYIYDGEIDGLRAFVAAGVDLNLPQEYGAKTALHRCAQSNAIECVRLLVEEGGVDMLLEDAEGKTAADIARSENHPEILEILAKAGGDPRAQDAALPEGMLDPHNAPIESLMEGMTTRAVSDETRAALRELGPHGAALDAAIEAAGEGADDALKAFFVALNDWWGETHYEVAEGFKHYAKATLGLSSIGERDDGGEYGGPFELWGVADALLRGGTFPEVTGLKIFGDKPFPGFVIGKRDEVEIWILAGHLHYGKRNGFCIIQPRDALQRTAENCAREGDYYSIMRGNSDYNALPDYMEYLYFMVAPLDVGHVFFAQRYAPDNGAEFMMKAMFGFDDKRIADARRRADSTLHLEEALR